MRKNFFKGLLFCSFLLTISWYLNAAPPGVKATFVEGRAYYFPDPKVNKRKKIQVGISIPEKSLVQTKKAGKVELKFDDGTIVRVGPKTKLQLSKLVGKDGKNNTEFDLLSGRVWNKIKKQIGRKPQFKVKTRTAVAGVRGTIFGVDSFSEDSSII